jgi:hypothetical protein
MAVSSQEKPCNERVEATFSMLCSPKESRMGFGRGVLLWLLGIPIPIIILLALFWR